MNILVSACLLGTNCKYNGGNNLDPRVAALVKENKLIAVCPEVSGGLATPREPCEIQGGTGKDVLKGKAKVLNKKREDVTQNFIKGARDTLTIAKQNGCKTAILRYGSPSCGCGIIYDGSFSGRLREGNGVTAQLLLENDIMIMTEKECTI